MEQILGGLSDEMQASLKQFLAAAQDALGPQLLSAVVFGSAAEGRLRKTSDLNLILVLESFDPGRIAVLRENYRVARAQLNLNAMFLLPSEIALCAELFTVKFSDILNRRKVLYGPDPFNDLKLDERALRHSVLQTLTNLKLRLRERYALSGLRQDQLALALADAAGPLRTAASALRRLQGRPALAPKEALAALVEEMNVERFSKVLSAISEARENRALAPGEAENVFLSLLDLVGELLERARCSS